MTVEYKLLYNYMLREWTQSAYVTVEYKTC